MGKWKQTLIKTLKKKLEDKKGAWVEFFSEVLCVGVYAINPNLLLTYKFIMNKFVIH
jgi:hypothetical protein